MFVLPSAAGSALLQVRQSSGNHGRGLGEVEGLVRQIFVERCNRKVEASKSAHM